MTESEWLTCTHLTPMLVFLKGKATDRKLRLFACGCCRLAWHLFTDEPSQKTVEVAERFADGKATDEDLFAAWEDGSAATTNAWHAASSTSCRLSGSAAAALQGEQMWGPARAAAQASEIKKHSELLRHMIGPLPPLLIHTDWLTPLVTDLATAAYEERALPTGELDPARLVVLADALEEAGSTNTEILGHLRGPGPHVRGCWVVDLLRRREGAT